MDPNATLLRMRTALQQYGDADAAAPIDAEVADEMYETARALDEWLSRGGFLPSAWSQDLTGSD